MGLGSIIGSVAGNLVGSVGDFFSNRSANDQNKDMQYDFAKNGVRWRVDDARNAGVHPLYALGANIASPSPSSVGTNLSSNFASMGQDIGRAVDATRTRDERASARAFESESRALQLENARLQNKYLETQIIDTQRRAANPAFPGGSPGLITGQGDSHPTSRVIDAPLTRTTSAPGKPNQEPAPVTETGYLRTQNGGQFPVRSKDATDRLDDDVIGNILWNIRNRLMPSFGGNYSAPDDTNFYNPATQQYERMDPRYLKYTPRGLLNAIKRYYNR